MEGSVEKNGGEKNTAVCLVLCLLLFGQNWLLNYTWNGGQTDWIGALYMAIGHSAISIPAWAVLGFLGTRIVLGVVNMFQVEKLDVRTITTVNIGLLAGLGLRLFWPHELP